MKKLLILLFVLLLPVVLADSESTKIYVTSTNSTVSIYDEDYSQIVSFEKSSEFTDAQYYFSVEVDCSSEEGCSVDCADVTCPTLPDIPSCPSPANISIPSCPSCPVCPLSNDTVACLNVLDKTINPPPELKESKKDYTNDFLLFLGIVVLFFIVWKSYEKGWFNKKPQRTHQIHMDEQPQEKRLPPRSNQRLKGSIENFNNQNNNNIPTKLPPIDQQPKQRQVMPTEEIPIKKMSQITKDRIKELNQKVNEALNK